MELSHFHFHSWGLVTENAVVGQSIVQVTPVEFWFGQDEVVVDNPIESELMYPSEEGMETVKVKESNSIPCKWLKLNSNRVTPPNVRRNDSVIIMRMGETDQYYWLDFNTANVKRLETAVWAWSADPDNPIKDDLSNAYRLEISSHGKSITLATSQSNGEPFGYTLQLDTGEGRFVLTDTATNKVYLDSSVTEIGMVNADRTSFKLTKKDIVAYAPNNIQYTAVNEISFKCQNLSIVANKGMDIKTAKFFADTPTATFTGLVKSKSMACEQGGSFGSVSATGAVTAATVTADSATFKSHGPH